MKRSQAYYIRHGFGVFAIRNKREAKALYDFCAEQMVELFGKSPECQQPRLDIFKMTMDIYANNFMLEPEKIPTEPIKCKCGHCSGMYMPYDIWSYATDHAQFYWS